MRALCWILGGHEWDRWRRIVIADWTTNMKPEARYCLRCGHFEQNRDARIFTAIAFGDRR